jgi:hypothetical protein
MPKNVEINPLKRVPKFKIKSKQEGKLGFQWVDAPFVERKVSYLKLTSAFHVAKKYARTAQ